MAERKRDYKREYEQYHAKSSQKKRRADRNSARRKLEKLGLVRKGDDKDVDHKNRAGLKGRLNNALSNLRVRSRSANRSRNSRPY